MGKAPSSVWQLPGSVNAASFGVTADGSTNDTAAMQAAINYCSRAGSAVGPALILPPGTIKITAPLTLPSQNIQIVGAGIWNTAINFNGVAGGCLVAASMVSIRPVLRDFGIIGDSSSGIGLDFTLVSSVVYNGDISNLYIESGGNCFHVPNTIFSMAVQNIIAHSYNGHCFLASNGPAVSWINCYALVTGTSKAGYRMAGLVNLIGCNGLNEGDFWGVFGSDTTATDGFENDFAFTDYAAVVMMNCNIEAFATGAGAATASGIYLQNAYKQFNMIGGSFQRTVSTPFHSVVRASIQSIGGVRGIYLDPSVFFVNGTPSGAYLYTDQYNVFIDVSSILSVSGTVVTTFYRDSNTTTYPTVKSAGLISGANTSMDFSRLSVGGAAVPSLGAVNTWAARQEFAAGQTITGANNLDAAISGAMPTGKTGITMQVGAGPTFYLGPNIGFGEGDTGYGLVGANGGGWVYYDDSGDSHLRFPSDRTYADKVFTSAITIAPPASGAVTCGVKVSSTSNLGFYVGDGPPTFSAGKGSIYSNTTASTTTTRLYVNTDGSTGWAFVITSA